MGLRRIAEFYQPFISKKMPIGYQRLEVTYPIIMALIWGFLGSFPTIFTGHVLWGLLCALAWAFILYTFRAWVMNTSATREADGSQYVSPSDGSTNQIFVIGLSNIMTLVYIVVQLKMLGLLDDF